MQITGPPSGSQSVETTAITSGHQRISYQWYAESEGLPWTGSLQVSFRIFNVDSGGSHLWEEAQNVNAVDGAFSAKLGASTALTLPFDQPYWLAFKLSTDPWMADRTPLLSAPYAFTAGALQGHPASSTAHTTDDVLSWDGTS